MIEADRDVAYGAAVAGASGAAVARTGSTAAVTSLHVDGVDVGGFVG